ncbi:MAG: hypothetical protein MJ252_20800 [archaeon]|nr:hypothetical protein [archaeon]
MSEEGEDQEAQGATDTKAAQRGPDKKYESVRSYLDSYNLPKILQEGLLEVEQKRPTDPVKYLGEYLIKRAKKK